MTFFLLLAMLSKQDPDNNHVHFQQVSFSYNGDNESWQDSFPDGMSYTASSFRKLERAALSLQQYLLPLIYEAKTSLRYPESSSS
jgi:hypothetical protein